MWMAARIDERCLGLRAITRDHDASFVATSWDSLEPEITLKLVLYYGIQFVKDSGFIV